MQYGTKQPQQHPAKTHSAADIMCVRLFGTYSTVVTMDLLQVGQLVPEGPGPIFPGRAPGSGGGDVMTVVRGPGAGGTTKPGGGGGLSPKYDGGGAGLGLVCS